MAAIGSTSRRKWSSFRWPRSAPPWHSRRSATTSRPTRCARLCRNTTCLKRCALATYGVRLPYTAGTRRGGGRGRGRGQQGHVRARFRAHRGGGDERFGRRGQGLRAAGECHIRKGSAIVGQRLRAAGTRARSQPPPLATLPQPPRDRPTTQLLVHTRLALFTARRGARGDVCRVHGAQVPY
eukprot:3015796-Prymnesium_polylepis.1